VLHVYATAHLTLCRTILLLIWPGLDTNSAVSDTAYPLVSWLGGVDMLEQGKGWPKRGRSYPHLLLLQSRTSSCFARHLFDIAWTLSSPLFPTIPSFRASHR
jgi:hypothetical protein